MLVCARLRYMESSLWGSKLYMSMKHLEKHELETQMEYEGHRKMGHALGSPDRGNLRHSPSETNVRKILDSTSLIESFTTLTRSILNHQKIRPL